MSKKKFKNTRILCVGDIILDSYVYGDVERISPEAPIPILKSYDERFILGGAGNVARNICAGGGYCHLLSLVGKDMYSSILKDLIKKEKRLSSDLIIDKTKITTKKKRYISGQQQILRVDEEDILDINEEIERKIFEKFKVLIINHDLLVLSDYNKGLLKESLIQKMIVYAKRKEKKIIIDPKKNTFDIYRGATILTPNYNELMSVSRLKKINNESDDSVIRKITSNLIKDYEFESIITTRSSKGMSISSKNAEMINLPSNALEVFDVSGAGDTVVAYLSLVLATGRNLVEAANIANKAAGIAVGKFGTASVNASEVFDDNLENKKLMSLKQAEIKIKDLRSKKKIGFTNGCFDLIHYGHINYLIESKKKCDFLVLALNSDQSIRKIKGNSRPIINEEERIFILSNFPFIDMIILFDEKTPIKLIKCLRPLILFKGQDYKAKDVVGYNEVKKWGGSVKLISYEEGKSTTNMIERIKNGS